MALTDAEKAILTAQLVRFINAYPDEFVVRLLADLQPAKLPVWVTWLKKEWNDGKDAQSAAILAQKIA